MDYCFIETVTRSNSFCFWLFSHNRNKHQIYQDNVELDKIKSGGNSKCKLYKDVMKDQLEFRRIINCSSYPLSLYIKPWKGKRFGRR